MEIDANKAEMLSSTHTVNGQSITEGLLSSIAIALQKQFASNAGVKLREGMFGVSCSACRSNTTVVLQGPSAAHSE
jgi:hypothetical protein